MTIERRKLTGALAVLLSTLLAACMLMPGKFVSDLDVRRDGTFKFRYSGGITLLPLGMPNAKATFEPTPCYQEESMEERVCTEEELATRKREFESRQSESKSKDAQVAQFLFGGIDPSEPKAAEEIAGRLRKQKGWKRVDYKGNGLFEVDFEITGQLDHDFVFPTIERFPLANAFVQIALREDGTVRIDAPGFAPAQNGLAAAGMLGGTMSAKPDAPVPPASDGVFTIRTDAAAILANNTDQGPRKSPAGQELAWTINNRTPAAPMALLRLAR